MNAFQIVSLNIFLTGKCKYCKHNKGAHEWEPATHPDDLCPTWLLFCNACTQRHFKQPVNPYKKLRCVEVRE